MRLLILLFLTISLGCFGQKGSLQTEEIVVSEIAADFEVPQELIKIIESDVQVETKILSPVFIFVPLMVVLTEKTARTLKSPRIELSLPKGGGQIDLNSVVRGQGSFFLSYPANQFDGLPALEHLFYISQSPKRKIEGEEFGLGCGKWVDIKGHFKSMQKEDFLTLNTTQLRHLFVTAGHYIFVFRKLNQIFLTQLTITDSQNEDQLCPRVKGLTL